jgi:peptide/nickel transport system permease protein
MPGDPVLNLLGEKASLNDPKIIAAYRAEYGLDKPLHIQYYAYLVSLSQGSLGYSINKNISVMDLIRYRLFWTLILIFPSVMIGSLLALIVGSMTALKSNTLWDFFITGLSLFLYTCPPFLLSMLLISIFSYHLGFFPLGNLASGNKHGAAYLMDIVWHLVLPMLVLTLMAAGYKFLVVRNITIRVLEEQFVLAAKAKGLTDMSILIKHVIRNVIPPFISMVALSFGFMVSGALIVETVFSLDGMGTLIYDAVLARDYPVMQGAFLVLTVSVLIANLIADILYGIADPRIRTIE